MWTLELVVAPTLEPLTLDEVRAHLAIDTSDHDALLDAMALAARQHAENELGKALLTQTWKLRLDALPCTGIIRLPRPPLQSVTSIEYVDAAGATQTLDPTRYVVDAVAEPARIAPAYGFSWPSVRSQLGVAAVTVTYIAGKKARGDIAQTIRQGMLATIGALFEQRERVMATGTEAVEAPLVARDLMASERCYYDYGENCE